MTDKTYAVEEKLMIRPITMEDTDLIVTWRNRERVRMNFLFRETFTRRMHETWMKEKVAVGEVEQFIVETLPDHRAVGSVYFRDIDRKAGQAEYGVFIGEQEALGKGYGNLLARWAVEYAAEEMHLKKLILRVLSDNQAAIRTYENAGYIRTDYLAGYITDEKGPRDLVLMERNL